MYCRAVLVLRVTVRLRSHEVYCNAFTDAFVRAYCFGEQVHRGKCTRAAKKRREEAEAAAKAAAEAEAAAAQVRRVLGPYPAPERPY